MGKKILIEFESLMKVWCGFYMTECRYPPSVLDGMKNDNY